MQLLTTESLPLQFSLDSLYPIIPALEESGIALHSFVGLPVSFLTNCKFPRRIWNYKISQRIWELRNFMMYEKLITASQLFKKAVAVDVKG